MIGTRSCIVAQVAIRTRPPAQLANEASMTRNFSTAHSRGWMQDKHVRYTLYCQVLCRTPRKEWTHRSASTIYSTSCLLPLAPAAGHRRDVRVAHLLKIVGGQSGSESAAAVENQLRIPVGDALLDVTLKHTAAHVLGAADMACSPLTLFAHVDDPRRA